EEGPVALGDVVAAVLAGDEEEGGAPGGERVTRIGGACPHRRGACATAWVTAGATATATRLVRHRTSLRRAGNRRAACRRGGALRGRGLRQGRGRCGWRACRGRRSCAAGPMTRNQRGAAPRRGSARSRRRRRGGRGGRRVRRAEARG